MDYSYRKLRKLAFGLFIVLYLCPLTLLIFVGAALEPMAGYLFGPPILALWMTAVPWAGAASGGVPFAFEEGPGRLWCFLLLFGAIEDALLLLIGAPIGERDNSSFLFIGVLGLPAALFVVVLFARYRKLATATEQREALSDPAP
jgi:hypothetical protein